LLHNDWRPAVDDAITVFGAGRPSLVPALEAVQKQCRYIPEDAARYLAQAYCLPITEVYSVMTFYGMLSARKPGDYVIKICDSIPCRVNQPVNFARIIYEILGIGPAETTPDNRFTLQTVDCLGLCDQAPAMMVNDKVYSRLNRAKLRQILLDLKNGGR